MDFKMKKEMLRENVTVVLVTLVFVLGFVALINFDPITTGYGIGNLNENATELNIVSDLTLEGDLQFGIQANCGGSTACSCGDTLNESWTMTANLQNLTGGTICPADGLIIGVDNLTLNCQGYNISGIGSDYGIYARSQNNITIKNCRV